MHKSTPSLTLAPPPKGGASAGRGDLVVTYDPEPGALGRGLRRLRPKTRSGRWGCTGCRWSGGGGGGDPCALRDVEVTAHPMSLLDEDRRGLAGSAKHLALGTTGQIHTHWHAGPRAHLHLRGASERKPGPRARRALGKPPECLAAHLSVSAVLRGRSQQAVVVAGAGLGGWLCGRCPGEHGRTMQGDRGPRC